MHWQSILTLPDKLFQSTSRFLKNVNY
ncbi:UNVERIFIED_CONTAM: hypothetical protein GTU68_051738 [Idotea baltica]|nr:hypothetical protein [Idotea baltica]